MQRSTMAKVISQGWLRRSGIAIMVAATTSVGAWPAAAADPASSPAAAGSPVATIRVAGTALGSGDYPAYSLETPEGWEAQGAFTVKSAGAPQVMGISVWDVGAVPSDPCLWAASTQTPGPTVDDLVQALEAQASRNASAAVDVTLAGYTGRYLEWSVPSDVVVTGDSDFEGCDVEPSDGHRNFVSWFGDGDGLRWQQVAGQVDRLWILDVDGQRLVVDATYSPDATSADLEELDQVVQSLRFGDEYPSPSASNPSPAHSPTADATGTAFPVSDDPVPVEPGTYRIPRSAWSVADLTVTFPEGWTVQYGHVFARHPDEDDEFGFYPVVVDSIWAEACAGSNSGDPVAVGPSVDDLAAALLQQPGPMASEPVETTFGGYPATRIDLTVPEGFALDACNAAGIGLQIWYSPAADKNFILVADGMASVYILDVDGARQVFLVQHGDTTSAEDLAELQAVLDSVRIER